MRKYASQFNLRLDPETEEALKFVASAMRRTLADTIRVLIQDEDKRQRALGATEAKKGEL